MITVPEPKTISAETMLRAIISALCKFTPNPSIGFSQERQAFIVQVDGRDQGRIIGRKGINFWAINALMWYAGTVTYRYPVRVEVLEPRQRSQTPEMPFKPDPNWSTARIHKLVHIIVTACFGTTHHGWEVTKDPNDLSDGTVTIHGEQYLPHAEPDIAEALSVILRAAGMLLGAKLTVKVQWV